MGRYIDCLLRDKIMKRPPRIFVGRQELFQTVGDVRTTIGHSEVNLDLDHIFALRRDSLDPEMVRIYMKGDDLFWVLEDPDKKVDAAWNEYLMWKDTPSMFSQN